MDTVDKVPFDSLYTSNSISTNSSFQQTVTVQVVTDIFQMMKSIEPIESENPMTFEELGLRHGFVYYETEISFIPSDPIELKIDLLHDRALVFINNEYRATLSRMDDINTTPLSDVRKGDVLGIFVENQGRQCCSKSLDLKVCIKSYCLINGKRS